MNQQHKTIVRAGKPLAEADKAIIMVHGRGADAADILGLTPYLALEGFALLAPEASGYAWYPFSFLAPVQRNEPGLSSGLALLGQAVAEARAAGIAAEDIYLLGFSQGACLSAEFAARHAGRYGGLFFLSGGLIGEALDTSNYQGDFGGTPAFFGCSDVDPHIPLGRVQESAAIFRQMGAEVTERIYPNAPHTVLEDEIEQVNRWLAGGGRDDS